MPAEFNLTIAACLLSLPLASLLWAVLCFTVAVAAFSIQIPDPKGVFLLVAVLGATVLCGIAILMFFWSIWEESPHTEIEDGYSEDIFYDDETVHKNESSSRSIFQVVRQRMVGWIRHQGKISRGMSTAIVNGAEAA
jgi:hypothetical protein